LATHRRRRPVRPRRIPRPCRPDQGHDHPRGENIYPKEIENVLYAHPDVVEAAVVGAAHPVYGEVPVAFVALRARSAATGDDLRAHCAGSLARMKIPTRIDLVEALPKNAVGKIDKPTLRKGLQGSG
jgi:long-chain acyl-CoA synthetase